MRQVGTGERVARRLGLLVVGPRSTWDLHYTGLRGSPRYYGSWGSFALGVAGLAGTSLGLTYGFLVGATGMLSSVMLLAPEWSAHRKGQVSVEPVPHFRVEMDLGVAQELRHQTEQDELAVIDGVVDQALLDTRARISWTSVRTPIPREVARHAFDILAQRTRSSRAVFNGSLVRQDDDLTAELLRSDGVVRLSKTDYFSLVCSNYLVGSRLVDRSTGTVVVDGTRLVADRDGRLRSLVESRLANPIGVSTLAVSADHRLVLVKQHRQVLSSPNLYAPAGSGSVDFQDHRFARRHGLVELKELVAHAMRRELGEECAIDPATELGVTEVLGYFRWADKGAKPEYVGITRIDLSSDDIRDRQVRLVEKRYVERIVVSRVDFQQLRDQPDSLACLRPEIAESASTPLYVCLRRLGQCLDLPGAIGARVRQMVGLDR